MAFQGAASTVVARLFRLINSAGVIVGEFASTLVIPLLTKSAGIKMNHSTSHASYLGWSTQDTEPGNPHQLVLAMPNESPQVAMEKSELGNGEIMTLTANGASIIVHSVNGITETSAPGGVHRINAPSVVVNATVSSSVMQANTSVRLAPTTNLILGSRTAYMMVGAYRASAGATGNQVGPYGPTIIAATSLGPIALLAGDLVQMDAQSYIGCVVGGGFAQTVIYVNGVTAGCSATYSATTPGNTISVVTEPFFYTVPINGNYTFDMRFVVGAGTYNASGSTLRLTVFANH